MSHFLLHILLNTEFDVLAIEFPLTFYVLKSCNNRIGLLGMHKE